MAAQKRKTTLQKRYRYGDGKVVPELRLSGVWLEEIGFTGGKKVDVRISRGKLVITASNG
ncbi:SymE family type I addiction module toxin [Parapedobacter deserti]|uniref:SymE family type I addiction module toxin n=1 Tax=Parapedobacter deserti TaxID=1912957 RepID=A0ABV7JKG4_9SPHI